MSKPQFEDFILETISKLAGARFKQAEEEINRAGQAILEELATVRGRLDGILHKGLIDEAVSEISCRVEEHVRNIETGFERKLAESIAANDDVWHAKQLQAVSETDEAWQARLTRSIESAEESWRKKQLDGESFWRSKLDAALTGSNAEWQRKLEQAAAEANESWQARLQQSLETADESWKKKLADAESFWRSKLDAAVAGNTADWQRKLDQAMGKGAAQAVAENDASWKRKFDRAVADAVEARGKGAPVGAPSKPSPADRVRIEALVSAGNDIIASSNQTDILLRLLAATRHFAGRIVLFVLKGDSLGAWKTEGKAWAADRPNVSAISVGRTSDTAVAVAQHDMKVLREAPGARPGNQALVAMLGGEKPDLVLAAPIVVAGKSPAVLYADHRAADPEPMDIDTILYMVSLVQHRIETLGLLQKQGHREIAPPVPPPPPPKPEPRPVPPPASPPKPAPAPPPPPPRTEPAPSKPPASPATARFGPPSKAPAPPAAKPFGKDTFDLDDLLGTGPPEKAPAPPPAPPVPSGKPAAAGAPADPKRAAAERLARILVSEIKLYNESAVAQGRKGGNIYQMLKRDIDVSREHYTSKVAPEVAKAGDLLHEELVRTLCLGDPKLLGPGYPGPMKG